MNIRFYHAKILLTGENHSFSLTDGELWVQGSRITYIGKGKDNRKDNSRAEENGDGQAVQADEDIHWDRQIDTGGNVLIPGFKDAHTHSAMTFLRSFADDMPLQDWLNRQVFPREAQLTDEDVYHLTKLAVMEYLTSGITSNFDMYFSVLPGARATADCGFRTVFTSGLNDFCQSLEEVEELYGTIREMSSRTTFVPGFHAEYTTSLPLMEGLAKLAQKLHAPVWLHNSETEKEVADCISRYGKTPTELTDELGMYAYGGGGYHCIYFSAHDMEIFRERKLSIVTNPASNLKLASGIAPVKAFVEHGINVAIGTDGPASNNCLDMFREMFLVTGLSKVREKDAACMPAEEVLYMATAGGAAAMGLADGDRLAEGKLADLVMIDMHQPNMQPENDFVKNLVYAGSKQNVLLTMVGGRILYEKQQFSIGTEPEEVYRHANEIIRRMQT